MRARRELGASCSRTWRELGASSARAVRTSRMKTFSNIPNILGRPSRSTSTSFPKHFHSIPMHFIHSSLTLHSLFTLPFPLPTPHRSESTLKGGEDVTDRVCYLPVPPHTLSHPVPFLHPLPSRASDGRHARSLSASHARISALSLSIALLGTGACTLEEEGCMRDTRLSVRYCLC